MVSGNQHYRLTGWRSAPFALLALLAAPLVACSGIAASNEAPPVAALDSNYKQIVADKLHATFKNYAAYDSFQISEPRWVHAVSGWSWLICVRFQDHDRTRNYALFLQSNKIADNRYAVEIDGCDTQAYVPFDLMGGGGLSPLH